MPPRPANTLLARFLAAVVALGGCAFLNAAIRMGESLRHDGVISFGASSQFHGWGLPFLFTVVFLFAAFVAISVWTTRPNSWILFAAAWAVFSLILCWINFIARENADFHLTIYTFGFVILGAQGSISLRRQLSALRSNQRLERP